MTNPLQLKKVLINLLSNGVEAMRNVGMEAEAILITVRIHAELRMAHVSIQDSGPGLSEERLQRIFEPFFTTKRDGVGLGLAISRALIEAHGGKLWAEMTPAAGARFHFTLPFSP
jgi:signal transduction histidine kinase